MMTSMMPHCNKTPVRPQMDTASETEDEREYHCGYPKTIRVDQGSEFVSRDLDMSIGARTAARTIRV
jgi:hypothetical protein